jgi:glycine cleavage system pyridoxal-binding protein P
MALFVVLFTLGILFGVVVTLGINKLAEKSFGKKDRLEQSLKELEVGFKQLDQKHLDLYVEIEQMRNILKINGFEKDVDMPLVLRTLSEKIETIRLNHEFNKKSNNETIKALSQEVLMVKKFVTRIAANNEY